MLLAEKLFLNTQRAGQWGLEGVRVDVVLPHSVLQTFLQQPILLFRLWQGMICFD